MNADRCVWIDLDNSLHVPFFRPMVLRLSAATRTFPELKIVQLESTGAAPGRWADALTYWRQHYARVGEWFCRQLLLHHCVRWAARFSQRMIGQGGSDGGPGILAENAACLKWRLFGAEFTDVVLGSGDHRVARPPKESEVG